MEDKLFCLMTPEEYRVDILIIGVDHKTIENIDHYECMGVVSINKKNLYKQDDIIGPMSVSYITSYNNSPTMINYEFMGHLRKFHKYHGDFYIVRKNSLSFHMEHPVDQLQELYENTNIRGGQFTIFKRAYSPL